MLKTVEVLHIYSGTVRGLLLGGTVIVCIEASPRLPYCASSSWPYHSKWLGKGALRLGQANRVVILWPADMINSGPIVEKL
jgi:hypothetical protein